MTIRQGAVVAVSEAPGAGEIPSGTTVLLGREAGARRLRELTVGTPVEVGYDLDAGATVPCAFALGAHPLVTDRQSLPGLDTVTAEPRAAVGIAEDGRVLHLLSTDGRGGSSSGLTVAELADVLRSLGCEQAAYLDGGGSATLVTRGAGGVAVRNDLDQGQERPVPNGIGISATGS
ncbi:phosphodiester glycosidase family protein [Kitasatospora sp. NPDC101801]|uniref:phosphodiester glycosidase family protein n=1 Tax=Kitasatospora sp. NPDC101801 TaxID=3364103 RepID=UPI00381A4EE1